MSAAYRSGDNYRNGWATYRGGVVKASQKIQLKRRTAIGAPGAQRFKLVETGKLGAVKIEAI